METQYTEQEYRPSQSLFDLLPAVPEKPKAIRAELIDEAFEKCNASRKEAGYKPLAKSFYAVRVNSTCPEDIDVHYLLTACRRGVFSKVFFGATK